MTSAELLYRYNRGERDFRSVILNGEDLSSQKLDGIDFAGAILRGTNFLGAQLAGVDLRLTDLAGANFTNADLTTAKLGNDTNLGKAVFDGTRITQEQRDFILNARRMDERNMFVVVPSAPSRMESFLGSLHRGR